MSPVDDTSSAATKDGGGASSAARTAAPVAGTAARKARQQEQRSAPAARARTAGGSARGHTTSSVTRSTERATARELDPDRLAALEEERDFLLRSLADLEREHDAGDVDDGDYAALKDDYTARAASVLRALESRRVTAQAVRRPRRTGRGWLVVGGVLLIGVLAGVAVAQASGRREAGGTLSGGIRQTTRDQLLQAQQLFSEGKLLDAVKVYDEVLAAQPANAEALTYKGWLLRLTANESTNEVDRQALLGKARQSLDQAVQVDPTYADARIFRASLLNELDRPQEALADLDAVKPGSVPAMLDPLVGRLRSSIEAKIEAAGGTTSTGSVPGTVPPS